MFEKFFLWEIEEEIEWLDRSIYHLDGPGALQHLDALLEIPKLGAIQWVWGEGHGPASRWMDVYKRVIAAGKGVWITCGLDELETFMGELPPERTMLSTWAPSPEEADAVVARVSRWTGPGK